MGEISREEMDELPEGALDAVPEHIKAVFMPKLTAIFTAMSKLLQDSGPHMDQPGLPLDLKARGTAIRESLQDIREEVRDAGVKEDDFHTMVVVCRNQVFNQADPSP